MQLINIHIPNWAKFNPRKDRSNYSWFRVQNDFLHDQKLFGASDALKVLWVFVLCEASKKNSDSIDLNPDYAAAILGKGAKEVCKLIDELSSRLLIGAIEPSESRHDDGERPGVNLATYVRDERDETERDETFPAVTKRKPKAAEGEAGEGGVALRSEVWEHYSEAYLIRHKVEPTRGAKENSLVKRFCSAVPASEAAEIARYYVLRHNDAMYVRGRHPLELLVRDYQRIRADWIAGQQMTGGKAREVERKQEIYDVFAPLIAEAEAKEAARGSP